MSKSIRIFLLALLGVALVVGAVSVPRASAYMLANGCDEYDPATGTTYRCNPSRTDFYTPDGVDPATVPVGTNYTGEHYAPPPAGLNFVFCCDGGAIPPPAPFNPWKDYCSNPWWAPSPFEGIWQRSCYNHDVCYGSQLGRKYCDVRFWHDSTQACKSKYWVVDPTRYLCIGNAKAWYLAIRWYGAPDYKPRTSSNQP
jgi:hypothetical protein